MLIYIYIPLREDAAKGSLYFIGNPGVIRSEENIL